MDKSTGLLEFGETKIPFYKNGFTFEFMTLNIMPFQQLLPAETQETESGFILGLTHSGYVIAIYTGQEKFRINAPSSLNTCLYVVSKNNLSNIWQGESFDGITFCGGCVDKIYHGRSFVQDKQGSDTEKIVLVKNRDSLTFDIQENDDSKVHVQLFTASNISHDFEKGFAINDAGQCLRFVFDQSKNIGELPKILNNASRILSFLIYRNELFFDKIYLTKKDENGRYENIAIVNLKHDSETNKKSDSCISIYNLQGKKENIVSLLWNNDLGSMLFIPDTDKDVNILKSVDIKEICSALEYEIDRSKIQIEENTELEKLKEQIKTIVKQHEESVNRLPNKTYNLIYGSIGYWSNSLSDQIIALRNKHTAAIKEIEKLYNIELSDERIAKLVKYRNNTSHGTPATLSDELAGTAILLKALIYCNVLSRGGLSNADILTICKEVRFMT